MKLPFRSLAVGASHHLQEWCVLVAPHQAPDFELSHANYNRTRPICTLVSPITDSQGLSHHRNPY
jgi:hypothetical protein